MEVQKCQLAGENKFDLGFNFTMIFQKYEIGNGELRVS